MLIPKIFLNRFIYFPETSHEGSPTDFHLPFEDVWITSKDNVRLHAWWIGESKFTQTILFFHGNTGNISHRLDQIDFLRSLPVRFLLLDYRGYGKSQGKPSEEGLYLDSRAAYDFLLSQSIQPKNIFLYGESLGGAVAIDLASKVLVGGLMVESTFTSILDMAKIHYPYLPRIFVPQQFNSMQKIPLVQSPLLIFHGTEDEVAPFEMGQKLFQAGKNPKELFTVPGAHHNDVYGIGGKAYIEKINEFLKENWSL